MSNTIDLGNGQQVVIEEVQETQEVTSLNDNDAIAVGVNGVTSHITAKNFTDPLKALVQSQIVGYLTPTSQTLPTTRPDGTALQNMDGFEVSIPEGTAVTLTDAHGTQYVITDGTNASSGTMRYQLATTSWVYMEDQLNTEGLQKSATLAEDVAAAGFAETGGYTGDLSTLDSLKADKTSVADAITVAEEAFDWEFTQGTDLTLFTDGLGPVGGTYYAYGFPMIPVQNFKDISLQIYKSATSGLPTKMKLLVKTAYNGTLVARSQELAVNLTATETLLKFSFDDIIENATADKLWLELYGDGVFGLYVRHPNPTSIFTAANGYAAANGITSGSVYDSEVIDYTGANQYRDVWQKYSQYTKTPVLVGYAPTGGSDKTLQDIDNEKANKTDVQSAIDITAQLFETAYTQLADKLQFTDGLGPIGGNIYAYGFPIGVVQNFQDITLQIYKADTGTFPTKMKLVVRDGNYNGTVIAHSQELPVNLTATQTTLKFSFDNIIENTNGDRLWCEAFADGMFGLYIRYPNAASIFTAANGYSPQVSSTTNVYNTETIDYTNARDYRDVWAEFSQFQKGFTLTTDGKRTIANGVALKDGNTRISLAGSSVTWGNGRLQSGFVQNVIWAYQENQSSALVAAALNGGTSITGLSYYRQSAKRISGVGSQLSFSTYGNEISIVTAKERDNTNASLIDVYADGVVIGTIDNTNTDPVGSETKNFTGDGTTVKFDLGRAFTYGHAVTVAGVAMTGGLNISQGTGATVTQDYLVIRKYGTDVNGNPEVHHWVWFKTAPSAGAAISVNYSYGHLQAYEKTTIGQDASGNDECPYGDGDVSFDTTNPASISSGLDFREVDESCVYTYRFADVKNRDVSLKIRSLAAGATGTPYFIFNFSTNRIFYFQNAGIGGWSLFQLNQSIQYKYLLNWQRIIEWKPDILITDVTPNEDWTIYGHKAYTSATNVPLAEFQTTRMMPVRSMNYDNPNYSYSRWIGKIASITEVSVTASDDTNFNIDPAVGDYIMMGVPGACSMDYIVRKVKTYDSGTKTITWDRPINSSEINFALADMVGMELRVRDFTAFTNALNSYVNNVKSVLPQAVMGFIPNPYPNISGRELWGYRELINEKCYAFKDVYQIDTASLREWQNTQTLDKSLTLDASSLLTDSVTGLKYIDIPGAINTYNMITGRPQIIIDGVDVYGKAAYVLSGYYYRPASTGSAVNLAPGEVTNSKLSVLQWSVRIIFFKDAPTSGNILLNYTSALWSHDSTHMNETAGPILFSNFIGDFLNKI